MEARHLLKRLKDDDWYLGDTAGACRQYIHPDQPGVITVCVRFTDELGPGTIDRATAPAVADVPGEPEIVMEETRNAVSAYLPALPGCVVTGSDEADVRERMAEALALHRRGLGRKRGEGVV